MKKFYKEHRIFTILMAILLVCVIVIATVLFEMFYVGNGNNKYGNRLSDIKGNEIENERLSEYTKKLEEDASVLDAEVERTGKIIYIDTKLNADVPLDAAKNVAATSLEFFTDEEKSVYDLHFTLKEDKSETSEGFIIAGAKNAPSANLSWNNNRPVTTATEEATE